MDNTIVGLNADAVANHKNLLARRAAATTGGVPVYCDMSAVLLLTREETVVRFDNETESVEAVPEGAWRVLAMKRAAALHPELKRLEPKMPEAAALCPVCVGSGVVFDDILCGNCTGVGWIEGKSC